MLYITADGCFLKETLLIAPKNHGFLRLPAPYLSAIFEYYYNIIYEITFFKSDIAYLLFNYRRNLNDHIKK
ncbi:hypothetical protein SAMN05421821_11594 [Mucilaginibacter lappiensis]|uniref:Uncharacterized protein n=1 Tax=Mucilaginibacter lappiensis TaxID=354630 RepID=A0ABR6PS71_9SPHI|nr:hypothetical protein [Mucilaginibacter lappiensis]SIR91537.1 hypothetical protein SAMN05421821_11594 [Mucilaginibacter lappiensis]